MLEGAGSNWKPPTRECEALSTRADIWSGPKHGAPPGLSDHRLSYEGPHTIEGGNFRLRPSLVPVGFVADFHKPTTQLGRAEVFAELQWQFVQVLRE
jgi:hypothetical protein